VLRRDVEVALDVNGVMIHEFSELDEALLAKIRIFNLTFHYSQLRRKKALNVWARNANLIIERMMPLIDRDELAFVVDMIVTPSEQELWDEALEFYHREVWSKTGKQLLLQRDVLSEFSPEIDARLRSMATGYDSVVEQVHQEDFNSRFANFEYVDCPAGSRYFRIWNDGLVQGCPHVAQIQNLGNLKERRFSPIDHRIRCSDARYCDCNAIAIVGWMDYPEAARLT
jgi:MoaA/NifB/PqqE/SkfB family radical SAM enzyme